jgi:catechol 2,3-dioxygenase-like lactoylglutathione lyase family enzyme
VRISIDHAHSFASNRAATVEFFQSMLGASVVWDEVVAGARVIRLQIGRGFVEVYDQTPKAPRGGAFHHLGIETDDLAGLVRTMTSRGFAFRNNRRSHSDEDSSPGPHPHLCGGPSEQRAVL